MVIAIDGPAGAGKSTVARGVASGSASPTSTPGRCTAASRWRARRERGRRRRRDGRARAPDRARRPRRCSTARDVTEAIRDAARSPRPPRASPRPGVREALVAQAAATARATGDWVAEGRDIGTVVAPGRRVKVFLTASPEERARRRAAQTRRATPQPCSREQRERDERDERREHSPLERGRRRRPVDTTGLDARRGVGADRRRSSARRGRDRGR